MHNYWHWPYLDRLDKWPPQAVWSPWEKRVCSSPSISHPYFHGLSVRFCRNTTTQLSRSIWCYKVMPKLGKTKHSTEKNLACCCLQLWSFESRTPFMRSHWIKVPSLGLIKAEFHSIKPSLPVVPWPSNDHSISMSKHFNQSRPIEGFANSCTSNFYAA